MFNLKFIVVAVVIFGVSWHIVYQSKNPIKSKFFLAENNQKSNEITLKNDKFFVSDVNLGKCYLGEKYINWNDFMLAKSIKLSETDYLQFISKNWFDSRYDRPYLDTYRYVGKDNHSNVILELLPKDNWDSLNEFYDSFGINTDKFLNWIQEIEFTYDDHRLDYVDTMIQSSVGNCNAFTNATVGYLKYLVLKYNLSLQAEYKVSYVGNDYALYHVYPIVLFKDKTYALDFTDDFYKQDINIFFEELKEEILNE